MKRLAAWVMLSDGWRRALLAVGAGAFATLALPPYNVPAAGFVSFTLLVWMLDGAAGDPGRNLVARAMPAFRIGWLFGFGYFVAGLWWLGAAMLVDAGLFVWAIPIAVLVLPAILAIYWALAATLARLVWSDGPGRIFALAGAFALVEYLRGILFTGFPWNEIGIMVAPVPLLMQSVAVVGLHGLTLAAVLVFAAPALVVDRPDRSRTAAIGLAVLLVFLHVGYGAYRLWSAPQGSAATVAVRVVQPDIAQSRKWDAAEAESIFTKLLALTKVPAATPRPEGARRLVIWPESSVPFILTERPDALARIAEALSPGDTLIAGLTRLEEGTDPADPRIYNSIDVISDTGEILDARDKVHLVPFGEYIPFEGLLRRWGFGDLGELPGGFSAGASQGTIALDVVKFLPLICYEIIFQDEVADHLDRSAADVIVNVTNDAWFGHTPGPYQHVRQAQLTSIAYGLPLIRSANTGISLVEDAYGRPLQGLSLGSAGVIDTELTDLSAATIFSKCRNLPFLCFLAITWMLACVRRFSMRALID
ncbi:apolipoprotein N-acyltransferase [Mangrovibrevibacter kandeliae]|uniref:apolipoprotein N-acyltransferase n=1 Tax=Mangrovibrevibacter kandeliae TaxID=2968473 RepID=UPI0035573584